MRHRYLSVLLVCSLLGCAASPAPQTQASIDPKQVERRCASLSDCSSLPAPAGVLSLRERCELALLRQRCTSKDRCIAHCILTGIGKQQGGGCFHECGHSYVRVQEQLVECPAWQPPPGWESCRAAP